MATGKPLGRLMVCSTLVMFPELLKPKATGDGDPAYSACFILRPDHIQVQEIIDEMKAVCTAKWREAADAAYEEMYSQDRLALHSGFSKARYQHFANNLYISARAKLSQPPTVVDGERNPVAVVLPGSICNISIDLWAQDNKHGKRINANLRGVQIVSPPGVATATSVCEFA